MRPNKGTTAEPPRSAVDRDNLSGWARFVDRLPFRIGLLAVAAVAALGWVWSFAALRDYVHTIHRGPGLPVGFDLPWIFPLVVDGLAVAMSVVIWQAALDARPAILARLTLAASTGGSVFFNMEHAGIEWSARAVAAWSPVAANIAFEFLLSELRITVLRRRGLKARRPIPGVHPIRWILSPFATFGHWRTLVLEITEVRPPEFDGVDETLDHSADAAREPVAQPADMSTEPLAQPGSPLVQPEPTTALQQSAPSGALQPVSRWPALDRSGVDEAATARTTPVEPAWTEPQAPPSSAVNQSGPADGEPVRSGSGPSTRTAPRPAATDSRDEVARLYAALGDQGPKLTIRAAARTVAADSNLSESTVRRYISELRNGPDPVAASQAEPLAHLANEPVDQPEAVQVAHGGDGGSTAGPWLPDQGYGEPDHDGVSHSYEPAVSQR